MDILFWDIDGTLLNTGLAGLYAIEEAFSELQGGNVEIPLIAAGGRTDNYICQQMLYKTSGKMPTHEEVDDFCRHYETLLAKWLKTTNGKRFDAAFEIVKYFHEKPDYVQLLLTGNSSYGARKKLEQFGLDTYFDFEHSGFAEAFYYRDDLARFAWEKVKKVWGDQIKDVFVIGDTPYDVQCGKAIGAKTIAVATGHYSLDKLIACEPWWYMEKLPSPQAFEAKIND